LTPIGQVNTIQNGTYVKTDSMETKKLDVEKLKAKRAEFDTVVINDELLLDGGRILLNLDIENTKNILDKLEVPVLKLFLEHIRVLEKLAEKYIIDKS
jgi:hypothetical protein